MNEVLDQPTLAQKLVLVAGGDVPGWTYKFKVPPVTHAQWGTADWVKWVDACRGWRRDRPMPRG